MDFWDQTATIEGWFSYEEAHQYHELLVGLPDGATVVEVGVYCGRSTSVPGQLSMTKPLKLNCVDTFSTEFNGDLYLLKFVDNMDRLGIHGYEIFAGDSNKAKHAFPLESVDLVFIDADHEKTGIELDCEVWLPRLKHGGWAVFHDYEPRNYADVFDTVRKVCAGWEGSHVQTLAYRRKP
jgi:predicted O-methyltransferase YrrM